MFTVCIRLEKSSRAFRNKIIKTNRYGKTAHKNNNLLLAQDCTGPYTYSTSKSSPINIPSLERQGGWAGKAITLKHRYYFSLQPFLSLIVHRCLLLSTMIARPDVRGEKQIPLQTLVVEIPYPRNIEI